MGLLDKIKQVMWSKTESPVDVDPWATPVAAPTAVEGNPWKPQGKRLYNPGTQTTYNQVKSPPQEVENLWVAPTAGIKTRVLRGAAKLLIVLNLAVGIFFYSTSWAFNASLWGYLGLVTVILVHYLSVSR